MPTKHEQFLSLVSCMCTLGLVLRPLQMVVYIDIVCIVCIDFFNICMLIPVNFMSVFLCIPGFGKVSVWGGGAEKFSNRLIT